MVFMVGTDPIPIHARIAILTKRTYYFRGMFRSNMRERSEDVGTIENCRRSIFLLLLEHKDYADVPSARIEDIIELFVLAECFQMDGLMYLCMGSF